MLQLENVSYGIEPLEVEVEFQHLLYKLKNENNVFAVHNENSRGLEQKPMDYSISISEKVCCVWFITTFKIVTAFKIYFKKEIY